MPIAEFQSIYSISINVPNSTSQICNFTVLPGSRRLKHIDEAGRRMQQ